MPTGVGSAVDVEEGGVVVKRLWQRHRQISTYR